ncbi:BC1872 family protein [Bacillus salipaludis]|uniref:Phage ABA sandwich domain-containing protein n=1 Tax=Bacillus salipaludis TaxID=2547811 RepID=A0ABW8RIY5_9BACI
MSKTDSIARRILGWKLNRWDRWYDYEKGIFIHDSEFQPERNLSHAMQIIERLEEFGHKCSTNGASEVCINDIRATGDTLPQAITNAAYLFIEKTSVVDHSGYWQRLS